MTELTFPIRGVTYTFDVSLVSQANPLVFQNAPTIVAGDVLISIDGGATAPITNLPVVAGKIVTVTLTAAEMTGDRISVLFSDVAGAQWCDLLVDLLPSAITLDDIPTSAEIWGYTVRTLTNYSNLFTGNTVQENYVEVLRGDDWGFSFSGLGDITGNLKLWFTIKILHILSLPPLPFSTITSLSPRHPDPVCTHHPHTPWGHFSRGLELLKTTSPQFPQHPLLPFPYILKIKERTSS